MNLYALVFGESVLNDAVAISLYRTMLSVHQHASANESVFIVIWRFLETFIGSMSTGVAVALTSALISFLQNLECCLVVLFPYLSYMVAEGLGLSGIVAILFCGISSESSDGESSYVAPSYNENGTPSPGQNLKMRLKEFQKSTASFTAIDKNFLTPFFTAQNGDGNGHGISNGEVSLQRGNLDEMQ